MQKVCTLLSYKCIKCSEPVNIEIRSNMQEATIKLWEGMFDGKLCLSCYTGTDKSVEGAAENLLALLH